MMIFKKLKEKLPAVLFLCALLFSGKVSAQPIDGRIITGNTRSGISYVNILVLGKNIGTVSDEAGHFILNDTNINDSDSLRFSAIGYESKSFLAGDFRKDPVRNVILDPRYYDLKEVRVTYDRRKSRIIRLGTPVFTDALRSGFEDNNLGSELGIRLNIKKRVMLKNLNLNVAVCTFDTVTYRLNIYETFNQLTYRNILNEPIYITFSGDKINKPLTFDLSNYSITLEGEVIVSLELYKDMGEGRLLFRTEFFTGSTYHRKTNDGIWSQSPGVIGMYLNGNEIR